MARSVGEVTPNTIVKVVATKKVGDLVSPTELAELVEKHYQEVKTFLAEAQKLGVRVVSIHKQQNQEVIFVVTERDTTVVCLGEEIN